MKFMSIATKSLVASAMLVAFSVNAGAAQNAKMKADNQAIDNACKADAATASCGTEVVGKGLLKCLATYKKANKGFKVSDACSGAMKQRKADKKIKA